MSKVLPYYSSITIEGSLQFNCTENMLKQIQIASKSNATSIELLRIGKHAILCEGALRYFAHLIPLVKSVRIQIQGMPKSFGDTVMSVCKSLDFEVRTKKFSVNIYSKQDIGSLVQFFPLVEEVVLSDVDLTLETMVLFATMAAETFDRETREGREFPLKYLDLQGSVFKAQGIGRELMKVLCFVERVDLCGGPSGESQVSCNVLKEMARYVTELQGEGNREVAVKKLHLGGDFAVGSGVGEDLITISSCFEYVRFSSCVFDCDDARKMRAVLVEMVDQNREHVRIKKLNLNFDVRAEKPIDKDIVADITHLVCLIENLELRIRGFQGEDWAEMARVIAEIIQKDKDRFRIKKLKLKYSHDDGVMGKDIIRVAALIEDVTFDMSCLKHSVCSEADDLKEMHAVLSGLLEQGEEHLRLKKLQLKSGFRRAKLPSNCAREIINLVTLIEDVYFNEISFDADELQQMSMALAELKSLGEGRFRIKKLRFHSYHKTEGSGTAVGKIVPLIEDVNVFRWNEGNTVLSEMVITMLDLLRQGSDGVCLKKLTWNGCSKDFENCATDFINLVALLEEAYFKGSFGGDQFRKMGVQLSKLVAEQPDTVKIKKLGIDGCNLKEKGAESIKLLSLVENVVLQYCRFTNHDLQQMASILKERLRTKKSQVRIKKLSFPYCSLGRKECGEELVKLIRNLEEVDLQFNHLLPDDLVKIAKFTEDLAGKDARSQKHRTKSLVLSVFKNVKQHAKIAFNVKELHVYSSQVAVKMMKEIAELSMEDGLQGRQCRLKALNVVKNETEPLSQELLNLANEIGVKIGVIDSNSCNVFVEIEKSTRPFHGTLTGG